MPFVAHRGANLFYDVMGEGPGLVFLHGGGGNASSWWQQIPWFSRSWTCVVMDQRGFGRSYPLGMDMGEIDRIPEDVFAVMDALGMESAALVCQSLGGWAGLRMAMRQPRRVWGLVVADAPMGVAWPPAIEDAMSFVQSLADSGAGIEDAALAESFRTGRPEALWLYRHLNLFNPAVLRGRELGVEPSVLLDGMFAPQIQIPLEELASVRVPALMIGGSEDRLVRPATMRVLAENLGNASCEIIEGAGHSPYFEMPEVFNELVAGYLERFWSAQSAQDEGEGAS